MTNQQLIQIANLMIQQRPEVANSPMGKSMVDAIQNGDAARGTELAYNYCKSCGMTKEQGVQQGTNMLRNMFHI